jgi:hypothetical protein
MSQLSVLELCQEFKQVVHLFLFKLSLRSIIEIISQGIAVYNS